MLLQQFAEVAVLKKTGVLHFSSVVQLDSDKQKHFMYSILLMYSTTVTFRVLGFVHSSA